MTNERRAPIRQHLAAIKKLKDVRHLALIWCRLYFSYAALLYLGEEEITCLVRKSIDIGRRVTCNSLDLRADFGIESNGR
jgi:hypothetical protein